jgi:O-antigen/teichoic acid export membrane protein
MKLRDPMLGKVILSAVTGGAGWAFAALAPLFTTPVMLSYLDSYRYGAWMMLSSIAGVMMLSDFGITNGITSKLSQSRPYEVERRRLISNSYILLCFVSLTLTCLLLLVFFASRFGRSQLMSDDMALMMLAVLLPTALNVPLGFVIRLLYVDMRGTEAGLAPGIAGFLSVPIALCGASAGIDPNLLVLLFLAAVPFTYLCFSLKYFSKKDTLSPALADWDGELAIDIIYSGLRFVPLSLLVIFCNKIDYLIVARFQGIESVVSYSIADRIISIVNAMVTVLSMTLWPVFAREIANGNQTWVKASTLKLNMLMIAFYAVFLSILLWKYNEIAELWLGRSVQASPAMLTFLTLGSLMLALSSPYFAIANSLGAVREQLLAYLALLVIGLPTKFVAGTYYSSTGIAAGNFFSWALIMLPAIALIAAKKLQQAQR